MHRILRLQGRIRRDGPPHHVPNDEGIWIPRFIYQHLQTTLWSIKHILRDYPWQHFPYLNQERNTPMGHRVPIPFHHINGIPPKMARRGELRIPSVLPSPPEHNRYHHIYTMSTATQTTLALQPAQYKTSKYNFRNDTSLANTPASNSKPQNAKPRAHSGPRKIRSLSKIKHPLKDKSTQYPS